MLRVDLCVGDDVESPVTGDARRGDFQLRSGNWEEFRGLSVFRVHIVRCEREGEEHPIDGLTERSSLKSFVPLQTFQYGLDSSAAYSNKMM